MNNNPNKIILYGSPMCPMVSPVRAALSRSSAEFEYVDIFRDSMGRQAVRQINQGFESVPTLVFPDGSTLTEPGPGQVTRKLQAMGYEVTPPRWQQVISKFVAHLRE